MNKLKIFFTFFEMLSIIMNLIMVLVFFWTDDIIFILFAILFISWAVYFRVQDMDINNLRFRILILKLIEHTMKLKKYNVFKPKRKK